jgi:mRNA-degrading endonuclease toxin of MazEF toxin-antitoxin module
LRPWTTRDCGSPLHVEASPPEGGLRARSFALVDQVRSLDRSRLI